MNWLIKLLENMSASKSPPAPVYDTAGKSENETAVTTELPASPLSHGNTDVSESLNEVTVESDTDEAAAVAAASKFITYSTCARMSSQERYSLLQQDGGGHQECIQVCYPSDNVVKSRMKEWLKSNGFSPTTAPPEPLDSDVEKSFLLRWFGWG